MPITLSARVVRAPILVIEIEEVLEAKITSGAQTLVELLKDRDLGVLVLHYRFDHEIDRRQFLEVRRDADAGQHAVALFGLEAAALDHAIEILANAVEAALARLGGYVGHHHGDSGLGRDLRDPGAHLAGADNPHRMNFHSTLLALRCTKCNA